MKYSNYDNLNYLGKLKNRKSTEISSSRLGVGFECLDRVDLVRLTAEPLREEQPDAKLIGGAIAWGMTVWSLKYLEDCMKAGLHNSL